MASKKMYHKPKKRKTNSLESMFLNYNIHNIGINENIVVHTHSYEKDNFYKVLGTPLEISMSSLKI